MISNFSHLTEWFLDLLVERNDLWSNLINYRENPGNEKSTIIPIRRRKYLSNAKFKKCGETETSQMI